MVDVQSVIVYCGLAILSFKLAKYAVKYNKKKTVWWIVIVLSMVAGLRNTSVGIDTKTYEMVFDSVVAGNVEIMFNVEQGFAYICKVLLSIWNNSHFLFFVCAFVSHSLLLFTFWNNRQFSSFQWAVLTYYIVFYTFSLNGVRQFVAVAIVVAATEMIKKGKYGSFIISIIIASLFHKTALIGVMYLLFEILFIKAFNKKRTIKILALCIFTCIAGYMVMGDLINHYINYFRYHISGFGIMMPVKFTMLVFSIIAIGIPSNKTERYEYFRQRWYYFVSILLSSLSYFFLYMGRIGLYYYIFETLYIGNVFGTKNKSAWIVILKMGYFGILMYYLYGIFTNGQGEMPYRFFWQD